MSAFNFIGTHGKWHIETDGEGFRGHNQENNSVTGSFKELTWLTAYIKELENPPVCKDCGEKLVRKSVEGTQVCLKCDPFWNEPCRTCRTKRAFCCC